jgi:hypothetical protein
MEVRVGKSYLERAVLESDDKISERIQGKIYVFCGYPGSGTCHSFSSPIDSLSCVLFAK